MTRVPGGTPPPLPPAVDLLVPVADAFMLLMLSRPQTGSLRQTWVTPASLWLGALTALGMVALIAVVATGLTGWARPTVTLVAVGMTVGGAAVAAVGLAQRRRS